MNDSLQSDMIAESYESNKVIHCNNLEVFLLTKTTVRMIVENQSIKEYIYLLCSANK